MDLTVAQIVDFKNAVKTMSEAPEHKNSLIAIIATRAAIDLDHLARIISSPSIDLGGFWVQVKPKHKKDSKKIVMKHQKERRKL